jgi:hypothetical protein
MSELPAANNVVFIGNSNTIGKGPSNKPLFYPSFNNSAANIIYAVNTLPGSPRNFTTTGSAYNWAATNNFFINNSDNPIPRIDADGLALYLDANQPTSYPQTGTSWYDMSGQNSNTNLNNGIGFDSTADVLTFDGTDDYGTGTLSNIPTAPFALEIVGKFDNSTRYEFEYFGALSNAGGDYSMITISKVGTQAADAFVRGNIYTYLGGSDYSATNLPVTGSGYYNITIQALTSAPWVRIWRNNEEGSFVAGTIPSQQISLATNNYWVGTWNNFTWWLDGNIASYKVYNKELTNSERNQNYFQGNIVTGSLVFMVDANNIVSYPKSGTTAYALTGSNNGTLVNGVAYGYSNGGYWNFDGTDDSINIGTLSYSNNITLEAWVNTTNPTGWDDIIAGGCGDLLFGINSAGNGTLSWGGQCNVPFSPVTSTISITDGNWHHVVGTYNGSVAALYIDGNLEVSGNRSGNFTPGNIAIGSGGGGGEYFNGKIANVRIYSKALTSDEIQQNYQATKDKFLGENIVTNGLVLNLDSANKDSYPGTGTTWTDLTGVAGNSILYNGIGFNSNLWGGSLSFDSVDDYSRITNPNVTLGTNPRTLIGWFRATSSVYGCIFGFGNAPSGTPTYGSMELWNYADPLAMHYAGGSISSGLSLSANLNKWLMAVLKFDGTTAYIQIIDNGTSYSNSATVPLNTYTANFSINKSAYANEGGGLAGYWGTALLYNRALSPTEITQVYNATKTRFGL